MKTQNSNALFDIRVLVSITNYGSKNIKYLNRVIKEYQSMPCEIDIVVFSNVPKEFGQEIEVFVGLPTRDPWSLTFGHKKIFAERLEDYDLFIYSEDDMLITWKNIEFFLHLTKVLPEDQVSGFIRFELDSNGKKSYPGFHGPYHWLPESVRKIDQFTFAEFSNLHTGCYVLTRDQLRRAVKSGRYLVEPHKGRYGQPESAATDPFTQCGLKLVICISHISNVLIHHLPNKYVEVWGINEIDFNRQISFILSEEYGGKNHQELFVTAKNIDRTKWDKMYFDEPDQNLLLMVSPQDKNFLSVGCGYPSTETVLVQSDYSVTVIPLDPIIGILAASKGIKVMEPNFEKAFQDLDSTLFDCIIFSHTLHHLKDPVEILSKIVKFLKPGGNILISIPVSFFKRWSYSQNYLHSIKKNDLEKWLRSIGINQMDFQYFVKNKHLRKIMTTSKIFKVFFTNTLFARTLLIRAKK